MRRIGVNSFIVPKRSKRFGVKTPLPGLLFGPYFSTGASELYVGAGESRLGRSDRRDRDEGALVLNGP